MDSEMQFSPKIPGVSPAPTDSRSVLLVAFGLLLGTLFLFWPTLHSEFINYDDDVYVTANSFVQHGVTLESIRWAFTTGHASNWHPLTWISHMIDFRLYGLNPLGHHLTNVLLHCANVLLLLFLALRLTRALWPCAVLVALFAWHPLRIESVAWVAERKDVLSACFGLIALSFYVRYVEKLSEKGGRKSIYYSATLISFALALMSKPMLVTLPFLLLLLDFWPLPRSITINEEDSTVKHWLPLVREKIPFFALSIACSVITIIVQKSGGAMQTVEQLPVAARISNALVSYPLYLGKIVWPARLAVLYPNTKGYPLLPTLAAAALLVGLSIGAVRSAKRFPFLAFGWFWFLGSLVPVIGLVQVGIQSIADRYTYLPAIGIFWAITWLMFLFVSKRVAAVASLLILLACAWGTRWQLQFWTDSRRLFERTIAVTENNYLAHNNLGNTFHKSGKRDDAIKEYAICLRIKPECADAHYNLGNLLAEEGHSEEAMVQFEEALKYNPTLAEAHNNLGALLNNMGNSPAAEKHFLEALRLSPRSADAHRNVATLLLKQGRVADAVDHYLEAVRDKPEDPELHLMLGRLLAVQKPEEAVREFREALRLHPDWPAAMSGLAWLLATHPDARLRNGVEAVRLSERTCELTGYNDPRALDILGASYAETGRFDEAITATEKAVSLVLTKGKGPLAEDMQKRIELYRNKQPFLLH